MPQVGAIAGTIQTQFGKGNELLGTAKSDDRELQKRSRTTFPFHAVLVESELPGTRSLVIFEVPFEARCR